MRLIPLLALALALACSENKLHPIDSPVATGDDTASTTTDDSAATDDSEDPCADAPPEEAACDGLDEDCDGSVDEGEGLSDCVQWWPDGDADGLGAGEPSCTCERPDDAADAPGDCDDADAERQVCRSCLHILQQGLGSVDGLYTIDPDGGGAFEVLCDMQTDAGGWTLVMALNAASMTQYDGAEVFETQAHFGAPEDDNHLSPAFYRLSFTSSYLVDEAHGVPVRTEAAWTGGTIGEQIEGLIADGEGAANIWERSPRTALQLRSSQTTDAVFQDGDLRAHLLLNQSATTDLTFPVTIDYLSGERHLVFDSDFGYAGGRVYWDPPYDVADYGVDERLRVFLR